jgi:hypothetical protein
MKTGNISAKGDAATKAWGLLTGLVYPPPFLSIAREFDLRPSTFAALRALEQPRTMGELAQVLHCDNSNVTGIVRIKVVELSGQGEALLTRLKREVAKPPAWVKDLPQEDQEALRDILQRAVASRTPGS